MPLMQLIFRRRLFLKILFERWFFWSLCVAVLCLSCGSKEQEPETAWDDYIIAKSGNIPLLLVAPHGGDLKPQWIEDRSCKDAVITQDQYTLGIALQIEEQLNRLGYQPFVVFAKIHRIKVDLNRVLENSYCDDKASNPIWHAFHNQISLYKKEIETQFERGLLIDIHGHGHSIQRIELGYLLTADQLRALARETLDWSQMATSIDDLVQNNSTNLGLKDLIVGQDALGSMLENNGFPTVPSQNDPYPEMGDAYFSGGTNTKVYGSKNKKGVDAIQLELNRNGIRQQSEDRLQFSTRFAEIIIDYFNQHYRDVFPN